MVAYARAVPELTVKTLEGVFVALAAHPGSIAWLDAGPNADAGASYLVVPAADEHRLTASVAGGRVVERLGGQSTQLPTDVFSALRERWSPEAGSANEVAFAGGWLGWFGYECAAATLNLELQTEPAGYPDASWFRAGAWLKLDHTTGHAQIDGTDQAAMQHLEAVLARAVELSDVPASGDSTARVRARWRDSESQYVENVRAAQVFIADGEAYQLCLTSRVSGAEQIDATDVYLRLRRASPTHHGSFIRIGDTAVLSASPEQFIELAPSGRLRSKPIKGTRRRAADPDADAQLARELVESEKERAENVMIVDLMRNDLGRVAVIGSVTVPNLLDVESYRPVHQLVSTVEAQLDPHRHRIDAIVAAFPAGSMTGAPKHRAVQRLQQLESGPRGIYSGASGYLSENGSIDLAMNIRSIVVRPDGWSIGAGGGITALSVPDDEVAEAKLKAAALLAVLGASD